jgi:hypothetical protein
MAGEASRTEPTRHQIVRQTISVKRLPRGVAEAKRMSTINISAENVNMISGDGEG